MPFRIIFTLFILGIFTHSLAQKKIILGKIINDQKLPIEGASIKAYTYNTDSLVVGAKSTADGSFSFAIDSGNYKITITSVGLNKYNSSFITQKDSQNIGYILLSANTKTTAEVQVKTEAIRVQQKGDTSEINANAYKVNTDANAENLVQKMPGITMNNGKVQAQGEEVKKVFVDGKEFFGDDVSSTLKNLPAEMIDKVQIFDQGSDQSQFTGFSDGNTSKALNLITKAAFKNGNFGKATLGYGTNDRYTANGVLNSFKNNRKLSLLANANNINQQNFAMEDLAGVMSSGGGGGRRGSGNFGGGGGNVGSDARDFLVTPSGGITNTNAFGVNYSNKFFNKVDLSTSYFFNKTNTNAYTKLNQQYFSDSENRNYEEDDTSTSNNTNHRINLRLKYTVNKNNSFIYKPKFTYQYNNGTQLSDGTTLIDEIINNASLSKSTSNYKAYSIGNSLLWQHKFSKPGRTFSLNIDNSIQHNNGDANLNSENNYLNKSSVYVNQNSKLNTANTSTSLSSEYTHLISKKQMLFVNFSPEWNNNKSVKNTYNLDTLTGNYDIYNFNLSKSVYQDIFKTTSTVGWRYNGAKSNINASIAYNTNQMDVNISDIITESGFSKKFYAYLPNLMWRYNFSKTKNLRAGYRTSLNLPSATQLNPAFDNSNPLLLNVGNPALDAAYTHNVFARYSSNNTKKNYTFFAMLMVGYSNSYIGTSTYTADSNGLNINGIYLRSGATLTSNVNAQNYQTYRTFANFGLPIKSIKSNFNANVGFTYSQLPGLYNGISTFSQNPSTSLGLVLSSNISQNLDFMVSSNTSYTSSINTSFKNQNTSYLNQVTSANLYWRFLKDFVFKTDIAYNNYSGFTTGYNTNYILWNASIGKKIFKKKNGEIDLYAFDILHQNNSLSRSTTTTYYQNSQTNTLTQYFMLKFSYDFKNFGQNNPSPDFKIPPGMPMPQGPPPGMH